DRTGKGPHQAPTRIVGIGPRDEPIVHSKVHPVVTQPTGDGHVRRDLYRALHERPHLGRVLELVELTRGVVRLGRGTHIVDVQPVIPLALEVEPGRDARGAGAQTERSTEADAGTV